MILTLNSVYLQIPKDFANINIQGQGSEKIIVF